MSSEKEEDSQAVSVYGELGLCSPRSGRTGQELGFGVVRIKPPGGS